MYQGYCIGCGQPAYATIVDGGIGPYEYWGQPCYDYQPVVESSCCGEPMTVDEELTEALTPEMVKQWEEAHEDYFR